MEEYTNTVELNHNLLSSCLDKFTITVCLKYISSRWQGPGGSDIADAAIAGEPSRGTHAVVQDGGVLTLTAADESDAGNYTCVVENVAGRRTRSLWIVVSGQCGDLAFYSIVHSRVGSIYRYTDPALVQSLCVARALCEI